MLLRLCGLEGSGIECGGVRTVVGVGDCLQHMAICVESFWPTYTAEDVSVRALQDDHGVDKIAGDSLVQSLAKGDGSGHAYGSSETSFFSCLSYLYDQRPQKACQKSDSERYVPELR